MLMVGESAVAGRPLYVFCNEPLLGTKYAVCQETLTKFWLLGQETLTKTLLIPLKPVLIDGDMRKTAVVLILISALLITATAGALFARLTKANPFSQADYQGEMPPTSEPIMTISFPLNNTILNTNNISVVLNVSIVKNTSQTYSKYQKHNEYIYKIYYTSDWQKNETCICENPQINSWWRRQTFNYQLDLADIPEGKHNLTFYAIEEGYYYPSLFEYYSFSANVSSAIAFTVDTASPNVTVLSLKNKTYYTRDFSLNFSVDEPANRIAYSLDGKDNSTVVGNVTLSGLAVGEHNVTVYTWDAAGNVGVSETISFTVADPFVPIAATAAVVVVAACAGLLFYYKKRKH